MGHEFALEISFLVLNVWIVSILSQVIQKLTLVASDSIFNTGLPGRDLLVKGGLEIIEC